MKIDRQTRYRLGCKQPQCSKFMSEIINSERAKQNADIIWTLPRVKDEHTHIIAKLAKEVSEGTLTSAQAKAILDKLGI